MVFLMKRIKAPECPGFYYWQGDSLSGRQVLIIQISKYKNRPGLHAEALCSDYDRQNHMPVSSDPYNWCGKWWGPIPEPEL